jgi:hypothetical protein
MTATAPEPNPDRDIGLVWSQKLAAWWAILWPAGCCALLLANFLVPRDYSVPAESWRSGLRFLEMLIVAQIVFVRRIVWKNYGTFRVFAVRPDGRRERTLSLAESCPVWLRLVAFLALTLVAFLNRIFAVGPLSVGLGVRSRHFGFRLQAVNSIPAA